MTQDEICKNLQVELCEIIETYKDEIRLRDVLGMLDMIKHYFMMNQWEKMK